MSGICGIIDFKNRPINEGLLKKMNSLLIHRGPNDEGYYINSQITSHKSQVTVGLGVKRLSIIDLKTGHQPIYNEDKTVWLVLNGAIYNFQELTTNLIKQGHRFYTKTDTETLVHLYEKYGIDCLKYINGMFAFVLWDEKKQKIFLARDRIGKKPLYYTRIDNFFYFASEIKSFLAIPEFKKEINLKAIHYYLTYQYIPSPMTIFKNVFRLKPAHWIELARNGEMKEHKYWNIDLRKKTELSFSESSKKIRSLLEDAVKIRMIADVPLGVFLSGGLDSTIITGLMSQMSSQPVKTFTIGFEEMGFSELKYAKIVANKFNTDHHEFIVKPDFINILPKLVWHYDQPYADASALPSYYVARETKREVTVAINGDGGDENFAGYRRYKGMKISQLISTPFRLVPEKVVNYFLNKIPMNESINARGRLRYFHKFIRSLKTPPYQRNTGWLICFTNECKNLIYSEDMRSKFKDDNAYCYLEEVFNCAPANNVIDRTLFSDFMTNLPEDLLVKMDVACMANSLEARSPFLDYRIVEFTSTLPPQWKICGLNTKYILKHTFKDIIPKQIMNRRKQGFTTPVGKWFKGPLKDYLIEIVLSKKAIERGYFNPNNLKHFIEEHTEGKHDYGYYLWTLLMLELWHEVFVDSPPSL